MNLDTETWPMSRHHVFNVLKGSVAMETGFGVNRRRGRRRVDISAQLTSGE